VPPEPARRLSRGWAIALLVLVVAVFAGGSALAALAFVTTMNARPLELTCLVTGTFADDSVQASDTGKPGYSVQTEDVGGGDGCDVFYSRDEALISGLRLGETYVFRVTNLIGYSTTDAAVPVAGD
jgi:hypothetical protein